MMLVAALDPVDRAQLALALELLWRRLRVDGIAVTPALHGLRDVLDRQETSELAGVAVDVHDRTVLYDIDEVADRTRLSRRTVERKIKTGELRTVTIGRARRVAPDDLAAFIASHGETKGPDGERGALPTRGSPARPLDHEQTSTA